MEISALLQIEPGITAIIGSGGKTTLMMTLAQELSRRGTVIITTSTKIYPPEGIPVLPGDDEIALQRSLRAAPLLCVASRHPTGKLAAPDISFSRLSELAIYVLVEADGSKGLPLKAHAPHEPVIPEAWWVRTDFISLYGKCATARKSFPLWQVFPWTPMPGLPA